MRRDDATPAAACVPPGQTREVECPRCRAAMLWTKASWHCPACRYKEGCCG